MTEENIEITTESEVKEETTEVPEVKEETTEVPEVKEEPKVEMPKKESNTILVGGKPLMNYVTAVVMQFTTQNANTVVIKSRGKFISKAVDIAEVVRGRFMKDQVSLSNIDIGSESFKNNEGRNVSVSTIAIELAK